MNIHHINNIEEQLAKLRPKPESELIEKILVAAEESREKAPAFPAVGMSSPFPLITGSVGCVLGATIMFFIMTCCVSPKVEVREVVHYVTIEPPTVSLHIPTAAEPTFVPITAPITEKQEMHHATKTEKNDVKQTPNKSLRGAFGWLSFLSQPKYDRWLAGNNNPIDLDAMLEDYEKQAALARENRQNKPSYYRTVRYSFNNENEVEQYSPEQYQQLLKELTL